MRTAYLVLLRLALPPACGPSATLPVSERRQAIQDMERRTLERFAREHPAAAARLETAAGYAVFANASVNLFFATGGGGYGTVVENKTDKRTYMKMAQAGVGPGIGVKDLRLVFIFRTPEVLNEFIYSGWEAGAQADASAKAGPSGADTSVEGAARDGLEVYAMTESGLALQATVAGTKVWKDDGLN